MEGTKTEIKYEETRNGLNFAVESRNFKGQADMLSLSPAAGDDMYYFRVHGVNFQDLHDFRDRMNHGKQMRKITAVEHNKKSGQLIHLNKKEIAVFRYGERVYAIDEKCPHLGGPLHIGDIETISEANILCIVCPWHRWKIELNTGKLKVPQRNRETNVYPVKVGNYGELYIGFHEFAPTYFDGSEDF